MIKFVYFFYLVYCHLFGSTKGSLSRIVGGSKAPPKLGLFHASLQNLQGRHVCGAAVVSENDLVTAAHCVLNADPKYIKIVVGTTNLDVIGTHYDAESIYIHREYDASIRQNDIAIIKINGTFNSEYVKALKLCARHLEEGDPVILAGFGANQTDRHDKLTVIINDYTLIPHTRIPCAVGGMDKHKFHITTNHDPGFWWQGHYQLSYGIMLAHGESSRRMYYLNMTVFNQDVCRYAMRYSRDVTERMFCTFTRIGQGTCSGDSGGPITHENELVGIVSWGIPCAVGFPDVHTRISPYISWIRDHISKK